MNDYYEFYWKKRGDSSLPPVRSFIPGFLRKYSNYGSVISNVPDHSVVLDVGCGDGNTSSFLIKNKSCNVYGIDVSKTALSHAKRKGLKTKVVNLNYGCLPFGNNKFNVVLMIDVLEHLIDPVNILLEVKRVLRKGGRLILSLPNFARFTNRLRMLFGDPVDILHWDKYGDGKEHFQWFTSRKIRHYLNLVDFDIHFVSCGLPFGFVFGLFGLFGFSRLLTIVAYKRSNK